MSEEIRAPRPTAGVLALVAPIVLAGGVLLAGLGWYIAVQSPSI